jgi:ubiquinone/menaquinone biosynthesis C-methylase UbiE
MFAAAMAERAHPEDPGFQHRWLGLKRSRYREQLFERYRFCNQFVPGRVVVDVPCGSGWGTSLLRRYRHCTGIDVSEEAIAFARRKYERPGVLGFSTGDMGQLPLDDDVADVVICLEGFEHVSREVGMAFLEECQRVLTRDGKLILTCPVLNEYAEDTGNPHHVCEYPEEELIEKLNRAFRIIQLMRHPGPDGPEYRAVVENLKGQRYRSRG